MGCHFLLQMLGKTEAKGEGAPEDEMVKWHHLLSGHELSKVGKIMKDRGAWLQSMGLQRVGCSLATEQQWASLQKPPWPPESRTAGKCSPSETLDPGGPESPPAGREGVPAELGDLGRLGSTLTALRGSERAGRAQRGKEGQSSALREGPGQPGPWPHPLRPGTLDAQSLLTRGQQQPWGGRRQERSTVNGGLTGGSQERCRSTGDFASGRTTQCVGGAESWGRAAAQIPVKRRSGPLPGGEGLLGGGWREGRGGEAGPRVAPPTPGLWDCLRLLVPQTLSQVAPGAVGIPQSSRLPTASPGVGHGAGGRDQADHFPLQPWAGGVGSRLGPEPAEESLGTRARQVMGRASERGW